MVSETKEQKTTFKDISSSNIHFCDAEDLVSVIARKMRDYWTDTIFVKDSDGKVVGLITDGIIWNLIAVETGGTDPRTLKAKDIMYKKFVRVNYDDPVKSIKQLRELLEKTKIQRIGIVKDGKIIGLVRKKFIERVKRYSRHFFIFFKIIN